MNPVWEGAINHTNRQAIVEKLILIPARMVYPNDRMKKG